MSGAELTERLGAPEAMEAYFTVMGSPGVFGEKAELLALSILLQRPIEIYYLHGERTDKKGMQLPAEVFSAPTPAKASSTRPVELLHSVAGRHFSPLVRQTYLKKEKRPAGPVGVGLILRVLTDSSGNQLPMVQEVLKTPSWVQGPAAQDVQKNDIVRSVNGQGVNTKSLLEIQDMLEGEAGTKVDINLERPGIGYYRVTLQRCAAERYWIGPTWSLLQ